MDNVERVAKVLCGRYEKSEDNWRLYSRDAIAAIAAMDGWRPIEEAPRGRLIDIWIKHSDSSGVRWADCYYDTICGQWRTSRPSGHLISVPERAVTHWMEPPAPPQHGGA
jgi:hypothetical protein